MGKTRLIFAILCALLLPLWASGSDIFITLEQETKILVPHGKKRGYLAEEQVAVLPKGTVISVSKKDFDKPIGFKGQGSRRQAPYVRGFDIHSLPDGAQNALTKEEVDRINGKRSLYLAKSDLEKGSISDQAPVTKPAEVIEIAEKVVAEVAAVNSDNPSCSGSCKDNISHPEAAREPATEAEKEDADPACRFLLDLPEGAKKAENCEEALAEVPNKKALLWALEYFQQNLGGLKDPSCLHEGLPLESKGRAEWVQLAKERGVPLKELKGTIAEKGIENSCQFQLNDYSETCSEGKQAGYFIDLCAAPGQVVHKLNRLKAGTGTCRNKFADVSNKKSTVLGAFIARNTAPFNPYKLSAGYKALKKNGQLKQVSLFGLNETNNHTFWDKPIHTSPYKTSWGCPAIDGEDVEVIEALGKEQSLVVNYGPEEYMPDLQQSCKKED